MRCDRLQFLIEKEHKTQKQVASALGLSQQRFNFYVTGKREPDNHMLLMLANYFNVTTDYLLGNAEEKTDPSKDEPVSVSSTDNLEFKEIENLLRKLSPELLPQAKEHLELLLLKQNHLSGSDK